MTGSGNERSGGQGVHCMYLGCRVWDVASGETRTMLYGSEVRGHEMEVTSVAISPDSTFFVSGSLDKSVK